MTPTMAPSQFRSLHVRELVDPAAHAPAFSLARVFRAMADEDFRLGGFEGEVLAEARRHAGTGDAYGRNAVVPWAVLAAPQQRSMSTQTGPAGGFLVPTALAADPALTLNGWSRAVDSGMPVTQLATNTTIPRLPADLGLTWLSPANPAYTPATPAVGQAALSPKVAACGFRVSRQLLVTGGPAAELFIRGTLLRAAARALDTAVFAGTGVDGQPLGLMNNSAVPARAGGSTWANLQGSLQQAEEGGASPGAVFIAPPALRTVWRGLAAGASAMPAMSLDADRVLGRRALFSPLMPANSFLFGDLEQCALLALFGAGIEVATDPYGADGSLFRRLEIEYRVMLACDVAVIQPSGLVRVTP